MTAFRLPFIFCAMFVLVILILQPEIVQACKHREAWGHGCPSIESSGCDKWCKGLGNTYGGCSWAVCVCEC
uniref:Defensin n=1 Tax=Panagrolaimus superbus TaxID=310955 RepID=A0A914YVS0_9BILA